MSLLKIAGCYSFVNILRSVASAEGLGSLGIYYALGLYTSFSLLLLGKESQQRDGRR